MYTDLHSLAVAVDRQAISGYTKRLSRSLSFNPIKIDKNGEP